MGKLGSQHACWTDHQIALVVAQLLAGHHDFATSGVTLPKVVLGNLAVHWTHLQICFLPELHLENQELGWDEHGLHRNLSAHLVEVLDNLHEWWIGLRSKLAHMIAGFAESQSFRCHLFNAWKAVIPLTVSPASPRCFNEPSQITSRSAPSTRCHRTSRRSLTEIFKANCRDSPYQGPTINSSMKKASE